MTDIISAMIKELYTCILLASSATQKVLTKIVLIAL